MYTCRVLELYNLVLITPQLLVNSVKLSYTPIIIDANRY